MPKCYVFQFVVGGGCLLAVHDVCRLRWMAVNEARPLNLIEGDTCPGENSQGYFRFHKPTRPGAHHVQSVLSSHLKCASMVTDSREQKPGSCMQTVASREIGARRVYVFLNRGD